MEATDPMMYILDVSVQTMLQGETLLTKVTVKSLLLLAVPAFSPEMGF